MHIDYKLVDQRNCHLSRGGQCSSESELTRETLRLILAQYSQNDPVNDTDNGRFVQLVANEHSGTAV